MSAAPDTKATPKRRARTRKASDAPAPKGAGRRQAAPPPRRGGRWMWLIPLLAFALLTALGVLSYEKDQPLANWAGPVGHGLAWLLFTSLGVSAYGAVLMLVTGVVLLCFPNGLRFAPLATFGWVLAGSATSAITHLVADPAGWSYPPGGALGRAIGDAAKGAFSMTGSLIVLGALFLMALLLATHFAAARAFELAARGVGTVSIKAAQSAMAAYERHKRARALRAEEEEEDDYYEAGEDARYVVPEDDEDDEPEPAPRARKLIKPPTIVVPPPAPEKKQLPAAKKPVPLPVDDEEPAEDPRVFLPSVPPDTFSPEPEPVAEKKPRAKKERPPVIDVPAQAAVVEEPEPAAAPPIAETAAMRVPEIVEPRKPPKPVGTVKPKGDFAMVDGQTGFATPRFEDILEGESHSTRQIDRAALTATAAKLVQKLHDLGVDGEVTEIRPGPVVTMYEFRPAAGIKLSRIASLGDDLAMAMEALRVRIVAPIPGKGVVGFEVPNRTRETVFLKEVVEQEVFQKGASKLTMAIGKDIEGMPYVADLAKMPHLLIAGTTGSGKSVGVNSMIVSMLMRATPEELRFIMVDPKMLELSIYEGIPHLLLPVVTDPKKAALALRWGVEEMERRYQLLAEAGVRNIGQYNKHIEKELAEQAALAEARAAEAAAEGEEDFDAEGPADAPAEQAKKLPYIVIIIDELADLMMVAAKEVEIYIARLAQMARAAGIHLMVATQRPSTDVLTGVIKANFPSRISFQVASRHDSGTIINTPGAENLLGMGDMLILPPGTSQLTRVHGAYVSEAEINRLTGFWKSQGAPVYDPEILKPRDEEGSGGGEDEVADELWDQAIHAVSTMEHVSISLLQRKMRIGYNRAARMIERMEREGIVGPADGAKPREVLIRSHD